MDFDPEDFADARAQLAPFHKRYWATGNILGPIDVVRLMRVREMIESYVSYGPASSMDLFVLAIGEGPDRSCTKIGGLPYWDVRRPWPLGMNRQPLPFLAQFNFQSSRDIVPDLPGDVLLIFTRPDLELGLALEWESIDSAKPLVSTSQAPRSSLPAYHGYRWRFNAYPRAEVIGSSWGSVIHLPNGEDVLDLYSIFLLFGMQIGPDPLTPPDGIGLTGDEQILCTLPTVLPTTDVPHPFIHHAEPICERDVEKFLIWVSDYDPGTDVNGSLYIIRAADGRLRGRLKCL